MRNIVVLLLTMIYAEDVWGQDNAVAKNLTFTANGVPFEMIFVEGGTFVMGCTKEQGNDCYSDEKPTHSVTLSHFHIGKYQVTQKLWQTVMGTTVSQYLDSVKNGFLVGEGDDFPMYYITYDECVEFCEKLNQLLDNKLPAGYRFCLPTEAQWEYAARGGKKSRGYKYSGSDYVNKVAWYDGNSNLKTHAYEVGMKDKNELGIYNMSGNVWEWCKDWYDSYNESPQTNPQGPNLGDYRVLRGGSWKFNARYCRVTVRVSDSPHSRSHNIGFRLVLMPY